MEGLRLRDRGRERRRDGMSERETEVRETEGLNG